LASCAKKLNQRKSKSNWEFSNPSGFEKFFAHVETTSRHLPYGSPEFFAAVMKIYKKYDTQGLDQHTQGVKNNRLFRNFD
jgi:hypothetical protein